MAPAAVGEIGHGAGQEAIPGPYRSSAVASMTIDGSPGYPQDVPVRHVDNPYDDALDRPSRPTLSAAAAAG